MANDFSDHSFEQAGDAYDRSGGVETTLEFTPASGGASFLSTVSARSGAYVLRIVGDAATALPRARSQFFPVTPGQSAVLAGWVQRVAGTDAKGELRLLAYDDAFGTETVLATIAPTGATGVWLAGGPAYAAIGVGVAYVRLEWRINLSPPAATEEFWWDDIKLVLLDESFGQGFFSTGPNGNAGLLAEVVEHVNVYTGAPDGTRPLIQARRGDGWPLPFARYDNGGLLLEQFIYQVGLASAGVNEVDVYWRARENLSAETKTIRLWLRRD